jgi:hypothetical protein
VALVIENDQFGQPIGKAFHVEMDYTGGPGDSPTFIGWAPPGALTSDAIWKIAKLVYSGANLIQVLYANGNTKYINVYDNRASLAYS